MLPLAPSPPSAGLLALLNEGGEHYGRLWTEAGLAAAVKHLVVDEADMLTGGGYSKPLGQILEVRAWDGEGGTPSPWGRSWRCVLGKGRGVTGGGG